MFTKIVARFLEGNKDVDVDNMLKTLIHIKNAENRNIIVNAN